MNEQERNRFGSPGLRLVQLYILLVSTGRPYSLTRLAALLSCSRQTVLRMIDQIQRIPKANCETWLDKGERMYRIAVQPGAAQLVFNPESIRHLALCRDIVGHLLPEAFQEELQATLNMASGGVAEKAGAVPSLAEPWVKGLIDYTPFESILEDIQAAMHEKRLCRVDYQARSSGERVRYLAAPLLIIAYREALYLRCRLYDTITQPTERYRTLAVHRIKTFRLTAAGFTQLPEEDRDPDFGFPFHEPIRVRVAFWRGAATYVGERTWSPGQKITRRKDGTLVLTFTATSRLEVIAWVLSFGPDAELIEPRELREEMKERARGILDRYTQQIK